MSNLRTYEAALSALNRLQRGSNRATRTGGPKQNPRESMSEWLARLNIDITSSQYIHIAGTKGKGTTCLYTEHLICALHSKYGIKRKVGCLTSPHVTTVRDRIRIDSSLLSESCFAEHFWTLWDKISPNGPTAQSTRPSPHFPGYPSIFTLLALYIFSVEAVDVVVLETGLGGETDSTNVIKAPIATGITELGLDHQGRLGVTLQDIAWHKAGIFKDGVPAFSVPQRTEALSVLEQRANEKNTALHMVDDRVLASHGIRVVPNQAFQRYNAGLALALTGEYTRRLCLSPDIDPDIARCVEHTHLPAKFETISEGKIIWVLSSAHSNMSVSVACEAYMSVLAEHPGYQPAIIFSHESERDWKEMLQLTYDHTCKNGDRPVISVFCPAVLNDLGAASEEFLDSRHPLGSSMDSLERQESTWRRLGYGGSTRKVDSVDRALECVRDAQTPLLVLVIGSAYATGMTRSLLVPRSA